MRIMGYTVFMKKRNRRVILKLIGFLVLMGLMTWIATLIDPVALVERVGEGWVYVILFFIALVSGVSTFTSGPFYLTLIVVITGGLHPIIIACVVTPAIVMSDLLFLGIIAHTTELLAQKAAWLHRFDKWINKQPHWVIHLVTYFYFSFAPVSSDVFLSILGIAHIKVKEIWVYVFFGNLTFFLWLGYLVQSGSPWVEKFMR